MRYSYMRRKYTRASITLCYYLLSRHAVRTYSLSRNWPHFKSIDFSPGPSTGAFSHDEIGPGEIDLCLDIPSAQRKTNPIP